HGHVREPANYPIGVEVFVLIRRIVSSSTMTWDNREPPPLRPPASYTCRPRGTGQRFRQVRGDDGHLLLRRKAFFGVVAQAKKAGLVLKIVWKVEADVVIEPDSVLSHRFGALRMDHGPQALRVSFAADGVELVLRECRRTPVADAGRCEDLDQIRPSA